MNLNWTAEAKVLVILIYHLILGVVVLTILTNSLTNQSRFREEVGAYFECEKSGIIEDDPSYKACNTEGFESLIEPIPTAIAFILLGLYPSVNLIFIVNIKELKKEFECRERRVEVARRSGENRNTMLRPGINSIINVAENYQQPHRMSSFSSVYARPSTFRPAASE